VGPDEASRPAPHPPVGSVAQETARLLEALLGAPNASAEPAPDAASAPDASRDASPKASPAAPGPPVDAPCPTCGHTDVGVEGGAAGRVDDGPASVCRVCPVCQVLRVVRSVRPETLDRLADLAAAVTETLRDAAAHRWGESAPADGTSAARPSSTQVQDIRVVDAGDEDAPDDLDEAEEGR
jgi:hypothetical protein